MIYNTNHLRHSNRNHSEDYFISTRITVWERREDEENRYELTEGNLCMLMGMWIATTIMGSKETLKNWNLNTRLSKNPTSVYPKAMKTIVFREKDRKKRKEEICWLSYGIAHTIKKLQQEREC